MEAHGLTLPMQKTLYTREYQQMLTLLREKRVAVQVSQAELAKRLDWTQAEISKCETGIRRVDVVELKLWLQALGTNLPSFVIELYGDA
jgi:transcriptional regulator with XRE-family HTH domain